MKLPSPYSFTETLTRLRSKLTAKGMTVFATIDHQAGAHAVGLDMPPTSVLIFGNPKSGTPLMPAAPDFALDLPLCVLVREDAAGRGRVRRPPRAACGFGRAPGPVLHKAQVRFDADWNWDGKPTHIVSRSSDSKGYVQPTRQAFLARMGENALFHYNAQQTWAVDAQGKVTNVLV